MVVPVRVSGQLDEEEMPVLDTAKQISGVASLGHGGAALRFEHVENRSREKELENFSRLAFEDLCSEEVCDGARRVRELDEEAIGDWFVAKRQRGHLKAGGPTLKAVGEQLDVGLVQLDSELEHDGGDFGSGESKLPVAHLDQLPMRTESVQRELGFTPAANDHTAAGWQALDERREARCRSRGELEVVDHDHDWFTERSEVVDDRDCDVAEIRVRLADQVGCVEPAVRPPSIERGSERRPEGGGIGIAVVA